MDAARLHRTDERRKRGLTLVQGPAVVADVIAAGAKVVTQFALKPASENMVPVDQKALARLSGTKSPRGPVAVVEIPVEWLDRSRNVLVSVGVSDPGNVGTMVRTAAAFGWGFAYTEGSADPWSPKTIRAGAGAQFQTPVSRVGSIDELGEWVTLATTPTRGQALESVVDRPVAVLIGEEAHGLPPAVVEGSDHVLSIPTSGATESLNAAVAAAIVVYELSKGSGPQPSGV